jgi:hypothetical protein
MPKTFGADMKRAGAGLYDEVRVTPVLDEEAKRANLDKLAGEIQRRDTSFCSLPRTVSRKAANSI